MHRRDDHPRTNDSALHNAAQFADLRPANPNPLNRDIYTGLLDRYTHQRLDLP